MQRVRSRSTLGQYQGTQKSVAPSCHVARATGRECLLDGPLLLQLCYYGGTARLCFSFSPPDDPLDQLGRRIARKNWYPTISRKRVWNGQTTRQMIDGNLKLVLVVMSAVWLRLLFGPGGQFCETRDKRAADVLCFEVISMKLPV